MVKIKIAQVRYEKNVSLRKLSRLSGIPKSTLSNFENGLSYPNIWHLEKIAYALNVKINDLYDSPRK